MNVFKAAFTNDKSIPTKDIERAASRVKLMNTLGQSLAVILTVGLTAMKVAAEIKK